MGLPNSLLRNAARPCALTDVELRDHPYWNAIEHLDIPPIRGGILTPFP